MISHFSQSQEVHLAGILNVVSNNEPTIMHQERIKGIEKASSVHTLFHR